MESLQDKKTCSLCNESKLPGDFYSKGRRVDSACKQCQKKKKKAKYVVSKGKGLVDGLKGFIELSTSCLRKRIFSETEKLDKVIQLCQQNSKR